MGTLKPVQDYAVVVGGELVLSFDAEGRNGAASDIIKVKDWVQPFCSVGIIRHTHTLINGVQIPAIIPVGAFKLNCSVCSS